MRSNPHKRRGRRPEGRTKGREPRPEKDLHRGAGPAQGTTSSGIAVEQGREPAGPGSTKKG
jgi:hypothetical protein